jgi:hypothetical protein
VTKNFKIQLAFYQLRASMAACRAELEKALRMLGTAAVLLLLPQAAQATPAAWNPFSMTFRADNTQMLRGAVTGFQMGEPVGGCTFELHNSDALTGVQVVLDATRAGDCKDIRQALAKVLDPQLARVIVRAKGRVVVTDTGEGIGEGARGALLALLNGVDCTATRGAAPALALDPLQRVKEKIDLAAKRLGEPQSFALAEARAEIRIAQDDLEQAASLTGGEAVCNVVGAVEVKKMLEALPAATRQTLHATGVQVTKD